MYYHDPKWCGEGTWERLNSALRERVRRRAGRKARPSWAIIDSQSVRTTEVGGEHGFDGAKRVNGRQRHLLNGTSPSGLDTMGHLLKVLSHAANIGERADGKALLLDAPGWLWQRLEKLLADEGYAGEDVEAWVKQTFDVDLAIAQRAPDQKGFVPLPIRWVVERTLAWLGRYRRLSKDYEHLTEHSEGLADLASTRRLLKRLAPA